MTIFCIFEYSIFIQFHIRISNIFEYGNFPTKWAILKQNSLRIGQITAKYASPITICLYDLNCASENWCKNRKHKDKTANAPPYERWGYGNIFVQIFDLIFEYSNIAQVQKIFEFQILFIFTGGSTCEPLHFVWYLLVYPRLLFLCCHILVTHWHNSCWADSPAQAGSNRKAGGGKSMRLKFIFLYGIHVTYRKMQMTEIQ